MNLSAFAQYYDDTHPMMGYDSWSWGWGLMLLLLAAFIIIGIILTRRPTGNDRDIDNHKIDPIDIIKERYAKGEITQEQFLELKQNLSSR